MGKNSKRKRILSFLLILFLGFIVFVVFSHIRPMLPHSIDLGCRIGAVLTLLLFAMITKNSRRCKEYETVLFAFSIAMIVTSVDLYLPSSTWILKALNISINTPAGIALDKLDSSLLIILLIIFFTKFFGGTLESIYLKKGNLKNGLLIGIPAFAISIAGSYFVAIAFGAQNLSLQRIVPWIPWILIFIFGNAMNEELLFRGLFLGKVEPFLGKFMSNLVLTIPFVLHHTGVTYTGNALVFLIYLIPLSLAWGYIAQKTDSLLGSVLFHAGTDIPVVLVIFAGLS